MKSKRVLEDFKIVSSSYIVDDFRFPNHPGITHYFLSHFHADHYMGLDMTWAGGKVYSGETSIRLACAFLKVDPELCVSLPFDKCIDLGNDHYVTLKDAFHCPGAAVFVFDLPPQGFDRRRRYVLHTGDFRFNEALMDPWISELRAQHTTHYIDSVYLDTTYCRPSYTFPDQSSVLDRIKLMVEYQLALPGETAFVIPTYNIGKEKVVKAVCEAAGSTAYIDPRKHRRLSLINLPYFEHVYDSQNPRQVFIADWGSLGTSAGELFAKDGDIYARFKKHLAKLNRLRRNGPPNTAPDDIKQPVASDEDSETSNVQCGREDISRTQNDPTDETFFTRMSVFIPTGWTWSRPTKAAWQAVRLEPTLHNDEGTIAIYRVPYSEHSSFTELCRFVELTKPRKIIPTVGNQQSRERQILTFAPYIDRAAAEKEAFIKLFTKPTPPSVPTPPPPSVPTPTPPSVPSPVKVAKVAQIKDSVKAECSPSVSMKEESVSVKSEAVSEEIVEVASSSDTSPVRKRSLQQMSLSHFLVKRPKNG